MDSNSCICEDDGKVCHGDESFRDVQWFDSWNIIWKTARISTNPEANGQTVRTWEQKTRGDVVASTLTASDSCSHISAAIATFLTCASVAGPASAFCTQRWQKTKFQLVCQLCRRCGAGTCTDSRWFTWVCLKASKATEWRQIWANTDFGSSFECFRFPPPGQKPALQPDWSS